MLQQSPKVVGREQELLIVDGLVASVRSGVGASVVIAGEPGIGKSRLAGEAANRGQHAGLTVVTGRCVPGPASGAYRPLTEALFQLLRECSIPDTTDFMPWLAPLRALLPTIVGAHVGIEPSPVILGEAILHLTARVTPDGLVMVLEDLHWADADTVSIIEYLVDNLSGQPLGLVVTMRDAAPTPAMRLITLRRPNRRCQLVTLGRLSDHAVEEMIDACNPDAPAALVDRVRGMADGVPLMVEECLASPGTPTSFTEAVRARLATLGRQSEAIVQAAAVVGREIDTALVGAALGVDDEVVATAMAEAVGCWLVTSGQYDFRFRHALTREAVLMSVLPAQRERIAQRLLTTLLDGAQTPSAHDRQTAIGLALCAREDRRAGQWMIRSARDALQRGALDSAADTARHAWDLLADCDERVDAALVQVEALALSGKVNEALSAGANVIAYTEHRPDTSTARFRVHLEVARAAVLASRWETARHHLSAARSLLDARLADDVARIDVLDAEALIAADDYEGARAKAQDVVDDESSAPETRCQAFEIIGRTWRPFDLERAHGCFENALVSAEAADLPVWRIRALHELGTIDMMDHAGVDRLLQARQAAEGSGAISTAAVVDLQLAAAFTGRWELDACESHARSAVGLAERLGLDAVHSKALAFLAGSASMRADLELAEEFSARSRAIAPQDRMLIGFHLGSIGLATVLRGEYDRALEPYARGIAVMNELPHGEPASLRAFWPLFLASRNDARAKSAISDARRLAVDRFGPNRLMIAFAEAIVTSHADPRGAESMTKAFEHVHLPQSGWFDLARLFAAPFAMRDGWGEPHSWVTAAASRFAERGLPAMVDRCLRLNRGSIPNTWVSYGISTREADVLRLVASGLTNKQIAAHLGLSPRTVEKHVEALLRKASCRTRSELIVRLAPPGGWGDEVAT